MRFLCSCSAALVLLAGCGSQTDRAPDPFAYDQSRPLAVHDAGVALSGPKATVHVIRFEGARHVNAFLLVPRSAGRHPAVLFLHGSGGNREDLLLPAAELANRGAVTMTISQPNDATSFRPLVVNARRAGPGLLAAAGPGATLPGRGTVGHAGRPRKPRAADRRRAGAPARALVCGRPRVEPARVRRSGGLAGRAVGPQVAFPPHGGD